MYSLGISTCGAHPIYKQITGIVRALAYLHLRKPPIFHGDVHPVGLHAVLTNNADSVARAMF